LTETREYLKGQCGNVESELEILKNKKVKGASLKKSKDRQQYLTSKLSDLQKFRDKIDEVLVYMDYVQTSHIANLSSLLK
jgi:hypothetical protein